MKNKSAPNQILDQWVERDLTDAVQKGELPRAFGVEQVCDQIGDVISAGRYPVVTGESGVGKTAVVYELVRQVHAGRGPALLRGKRILQISFQRRASSLKKPQEQMRPEMQRLADVLAGMKGAAPFFRDFHLVYNYDLEPHLLLLAIQGTCPMLAEGDWFGLCELFECYSELEQYFVTIPVEEPSIESASKILHGWSEEQTASSGIRFARNALEEALYLTHRFLARERLPRKAIDLLLQTGSFGPETRVIDADQVLDRFSAQHRIPRFLVDPAVTLDLNQVEALFHRRVLGQDEAVRAVVKMIGLIKAGLSDMRRPFGAFLFVGPTGVGKTHLAQLLAKYLFGSSDRMIRLNMADYPNEYDPKLLFGDPDAISLRSRRGILTQRITGHPFAVMLLDELEKAHAKVHDRLLQLIDEGAFFSGAGESISCRSMIILATSNTGADVYRGQTIGFAQPADYQKMDREVDLQLERTFRFEFLNRFDQIVHFHPLTRESIRTIAQRELEQLENRPGFRQRSLRLGLDESVLDWLAVHGHDPDYGARFLRRVIERHVTTALADAVVREGTPRNKAVNLSVRRNRIIADFPREKPPQRQTVSLPSGTEENIRRLDLAGLRKEAERLLKAAESRLADLEEKKAESSRLLSQMNGPAFWDDREKNREVLDRYRMIDVSVQVESRLAEPVLQLADLLEEPDAGEAAPALLSRTVEEAARSLREWDERLAEEGGGRIWMVIGNSNPLQPAKEFVENLAAMETAWCEKLGFSVSPAAYGLAEEELARVVLDVEGPGASAYLSMEQGIHRIRNPRSSDAKVRIEIIPQDPFQPLEKAATRPVRKRRGLFGMEIAFTGRLQIPDRGLTMTWVGSDQEILEHLLFDLSRHWMQPPEGEPETARVYGDSGVVRDPRTGVSMARPKEVWKGNLDKFLEGWRKWNCR